MNWNNIAIVKMQVVEIRIVYSQVLNGLAANSLFFTLPDSETKCPSLIYCEYLIRICGRLAALFTKLVLLAASNLGGPSESKPF
jgi:hypothetical protein